MKIFNKDALMNFLMVLPLIIAVFTGGWLLGTYKPMFEGFDNPSTKVASPCPSGYRRCPSGDCVLSSDVHGRCPE